MKRTMQRTAYNFSIPDSLTLRAQGITRLTCLRLIPRVCRRMPLAREIRADARGAKGIAGHGSGFD